MKIGIIGTSKISEQFISAVIQTDLFSLEAIYSRDLSKAKQFASKYNFKSFYIDLNEMAKSDIDVVYIASPNSLHFSQSCLFLENAKHVICEKPIATKKIEFDKMIELASKNNIFIFEALTHLNSPTFELLKNAINEIGIIRNVSLSYNQYSSKYENYKNGIIATSFDKNYEGGALNDLGIYPLAIACALWGLPEDSFFTKVYLQNGIDGVATAILNYKTFICNITCSKVTQGLLQNEILGEDGGIVLDTISQTTKMYIKHKDGSIKDIPIEPFENSMIYEIKTFYNIIKNKDMEKYKNLIQISTNINILLDKAN